MQPVGAFNFADYCRARQGQNVPSITAAPSEISSEGTATTATTIAATDNDHVYKYVAMREPDPAKDAQPIAFAYYPQYAYACPPQHEAAHALHGSPIKAPKETPVALPQIQPPHQAMAYPYPIGYAAYPYAYAMPNYPVPVNSSSAMTTVTASHAPSEKNKTKAKTKDKEKEKEKGKENSKASKVWVGRTKKQVEEDNIKIAINEGIYKPNDIMPKDAKPDQLFWVVETDGGHSLRTFLDINEGIVGKGKWKIDPRYGNAYFVKEKEDKKEKK